MNHRVSAREIAGPGPGQVLEDRDLTTLVFDDNRLLAALFGEHDEHLALVEHRLGVDIAPRGNRIAIKGPLAARDNAQAVLSSLYERVRSGLDVARGQFRRWSVRYAVANAHNGLVPRDHWLTPDERQAILAYHEMHPLEGYRRLTFMMLD